MKEKELWMEKLKEKLNDHSEPIPASGWEQLEKELMPPVEKKIYPYRKWTFAAAAVVLLALVSSLSLYFLGTPAADEIRRTHTPALVSVPDVLPGVRQPDETGTVVDQVLRPISKNRLARIEQTETESSKTNGQYTTKENDVPITTNQSDIAVKDQIATPENTESASTGNNNNSTQENQSVKDQPTNKARRPSGRDKLHIPTEKGHSQKGTWSMGLSYGNSGGTSTQVGTGMSGNLTRVSMSSVTNGLMQIPNDQTLVFEEGIPYLRQANKVIDIKHHQPISFGLNVRKSLGKGFSIETGLTYTLLSSDAKMEGSEQKIEQKLHYLGIPLRANWNFLEKKLFTLYVSGGGMMEKCVYGKLGSEKENVKPLQFSVSGAVGAQINATKRVGIYVEPGVAYFFNDGSDVQTIRKENPFNFNIQAGVRFTY